MWIPADNYTMDGEGERADFDQRHRACATAEPGPVKCLEMPKPDGAVRTLGPTLLDRGRNSIGFARRWGYRQAGRGQAAVELCRGGITSSLHEATPLILASTSTTARAFSTC
jgi:hypothetical protein